MTAPLTASSRSCASTGDQLVFSNAGTDPQFGSASSVYGTWRSAAIVALEQLRRLGPAAVQRRRAGPHHAGADRRDADRGEVPRGDDRGRRQQRERLPAELRHLEDAHDGPRGPAEARQRGRRLGGRLLLVRRRARPQGALRRPGPRRRRRRRARSLPASRRRRHRRGVVVAQQPLGQRGGVGGRHADPLPLPA